MCAAFGWDCAVLCLHFKMGLNLGEKPPVKSHPSWWDEGVLPQAGDGQSLEVVYASVAAAQRCNLSLSLSSSLVESDACLVALWFGFFVILVFEQ